VFAQATPPAGTGTGTARSGMAACRADLQTLCNGVTGGRGARMQCLVENRTKASPECQAAMTDLQGRIAERGAKAGKGGKGEQRGRFAACRSDLATFCGATKGKERAQCLSQNEAKLSPECGALVKQAQGFRLNARQARQTCKADAQALCGGVDKASGGVMQCLRQNEAKVSPACNQALAALPVRKRGAMQPAQGTGVVPPAPQQSPAPIVPKPQ
jgi:hypothetical protein